MKIAVILLGLLPLAGCVAPPPPELDRLTISSLYPVLKQSDLVTCGPDNEAVETMAKCIDVGAAQEDAQKAALQADTQYQAREAATSACIRRIIEAGYSSSVPGAMYMACSGNGYVSPMLGIGQ
jgi:hypothetical protein